MVSRSGSGAELDDDLFGVAVSIFVLCDGCILTFVEYWQQEYTAIESGVCGFVVLVGYLSVAIVVGYYFT